MVDNSAAFFAYARERYQIFLRKEADEQAVADGEEPQGPPWTDDPILREFRFCNVFREDDRVTRYLRKLITFDGYGSRTMQAFVIARWFNRIPTIGRLLPPENGEPPYWMQNMLYEWDSDEVRRRLGDTHPLVTAAYMVKTPAKMNKLEGLIWCIEHVVGKRLVDTCPVSLESKQEELVKHGGTLKATTEWLQQFPYLGPFMAYEVVTDLRHTPVLANAADIMTWANPGPGAARGASRVAVGRPDYYNRHSAHDLDMIQKLMQRLLKMSAHPDHWPAEWPAWEMREVEHTLCEWEKYERARLGQGRPKQLFRSG